jgi:hypothetical protein
VNNAWDAYARCTAKTEGTSVTVREQVTYPFGDERGSTEVRGKSPRGGGDGGPRCRAGRDDVGGEEGGLLRHPRQMA